MIRMINYCQNYCMYFYDMLHVVLHYMTGRLHVQLVHRQTGLCKEVFSFTERPKKIFFFYVIIGTMMEYNNCLRKGTIFFRTHCTLCKCNMWKTCLRNMRSYGTRINIMSRCDVFFSKYVPV